MAQLEHIDAIEKRLWTAADTLRANSEYASNEYFLPVMGLVFLRHAYSRYLMVKDEIEAGLPARGGRKRPLIKEDFSQRSAIFLRDEAQFDHLVALPDGADRARAVIAAMESIEADYESLRGVLPEGHRDKVLMLDARGVFRKVSRKICDFSPEQQQNLLAIVWLYRGETQRYLELVSRYLGEVADESLYCFEWESEEGETFRPIGEFLDLLDALRAELSPFLETQQKARPHAEPVADLERERRRFAEEVERFRSRAGKAGAQWERTPYTGAALGELVERFAPLAEASRGLSRQADQLHRLAARLIEICERECDARSNGVWNARDINRARKAAGEARQSLTHREESEPVQSWGPLRKVDYFWRHARWLTERFPDAELCDVAGLVKLVDRAEIEADGWSLTPGRYVGVAPVEEDEDFDFAKTMRELHAELDELNDEVIVLAAKIKKSFEALGI